MEVDGYQNSLVINILQNIFLYFPQKKVNLTYLKRHEILMSKWWQNFQLNKQMNKEKEKASPVFYPSKVLRA